MLIGSVNEPMIAVFPALGDQNTFPNVILEMFFKVCQTELTRNLPLPAVNHRIYGKTWKQKQI